MPFSKAGLRAEMMADGVETDMSSRNAVTLGIRRREMVDDRKDRISTVGFTTAHSHLGSLPGLTLLVNTSRWQVQQRYKPGQGCKDYNVPPCACFVQEIR
jgi:hypothetical protein